jgi:FixJ family two-component response regulator
MDVAGIMANGTLAAVKGRAPLIVVIEDEVIVLAGYQMLFESVGYQVVAAASSDDALEQLDRLGEPPGCILADYRLKDGQTGTEAIAAVQAKFGSTIPGLLVTGDTAVDRLRHASSSGLPILHKPVNGQHLLEVVRKLL